MHDIIHRELQTARVADFHRRARQDRLVRDAVRQLRRPALGRVLGLLMARRSGVWDAGRARAMEGAVLARPASLRPRQGPQGAGNSVTAAPTGIASWSSALPFSRHIS
jgi:hypothetical protein